ncbi:(Fe-S)-binding protein [Roseofilum casamattae]|uniref:Glycolate oxidase iron-sulfur subunit n=1 Tax=Roseofilum casamattae BLCC-M143 TaxID=3022442 RepID=A0ABT7BVL2_9CYAN|nr:heterodisulfide reductase-related iron-sulfur binding cluster [Roseofilum casamattae]MDJ1183237.1 heterodisulfide reductase-related iron-sulfur binding cluster [Roseofilum casamattae BLCC-M143]
MTASEPSVPIDLPSYPAKNSQFLSQNPHLTSGFDGKNPPPPELINTCVHCGFCLATCPSYRILGQEMDSPRGRIYSMDAIHKGEASLANSAQHFDSCLGCLACTTTCPSGVRYDTLIAATRHQVERNINRSISDRAIRALLFNLFPYPNRLRPLLYPLYLYQKSGLQTLVRRLEFLPKLFPRLLAMESILPKISLPALHHSFADIIPARGTQRYRVGMILGCVQRLFFHPVNAATVRVLTGNGCEVVIPKNQSCCGALPEHQGQTQQAQDLARQIVDAFAETEVDYIIINAAGCGHTLKEYDRILADDPDYCDRAKQFASKVKDIQEFLAEIGLTAPLSPLSPEKLNIVYQDACHLLHGQKISVQPRQLLKQIPGVQLAEPIDAALCCGSAGVYNMLQPDVAEELGRQKVNNLLQTGANLIASPNPGCSLQISKHLKHQEKTVPVFHPMELLDYSMRGETIS